MAILDAAVFGLAFAVFVAVLRAKPEPATEDEYDPYEQPFGDL